MMTCPFTPPSTDHAKYFCLKTSHPPRTPNTATQFDRATSNTHPDTGMIPMRMPRLQVTKHCVLLKPLMLPIIIIFKI